MRTKAKIKGKVAIVLSLALVGSMLLPAKTGTKTAQAAEVPTVREVNLNNNGTIPGITNPNQPGAASDAWSGSYVYFGNYLQEDTNLDRTVDEYDEELAIKWRVLSTENDSTGGNNPDSLLLMSDRVLDRVLFYEENTGETSWEGSNIRKWLNSETYEQTAGYTYTPGGFLNTAFSQAEQAAIKSTTKPEGSSLDYTQDDTTISFLSPALTRDKIFLPSAEELDTAAYGFYHYVCWRQDETTSPAIVYTSYAQEKGVEGTGNYLMGGSANYWLRSEYKCTGSDPESTSTYSGYYDYIYHCFLATSPDEANIGVAPALNLDTFSILFTSKSNADKAKTFQRTGSGSNVDAWKLTLQDGEGFEAGRIEGETGSVSPGGTIHVKVTNVPTLTTGNAYTQISAMLVDDTGTVMAYGKVADYESRTGITKEGNLVTDDTIPMEIPADIPEGEYTLKIFAEDVNSEVTDNSVDFASNMAELEVTIENSIPQPKIQNVNLGVTGIQNPGQPDSIYEDWGGGSGNYVYFGNYWQNDTNSDGIANVLDDKKPIKWKVLSTENDSTGGSQPDSLLLYSDKVLDRMKYNDAYIYDSGAGACYKKEDGQLSSYYANDYSHSDVRAWLNSEDYEESVPGTYTSGGFLENAFDEKESRVIKDTVKAQGADVHIIDFMGTEYDIISPEVEGDKIFLLSPEELLLSQYGFFYKIVLDLSSDNKTIKSNATEFAKNNGVSSLGEYGAHMWLRGGKRSENGWDTLDAAATYYCLGIWAASSNGAPVGVAPALNLDREEIFFNTAEGTDHAQDFGMTQKSVYNDTWTLVLKDGTGFAAAQKERNTNRVAPGGSVTVTVTSLASGNAKQYTQMSAMLVDSSETVVAYGKISENIETGDVTVTLPGGISPGAYSLKVFEESVPGMENLEGYASNMASIPLTVAIDTPIDEVKVNINPPKAGQPLDTTATCNTLGVASVDIQWKDSEGNEVNGNAEYWCTYTAYITILPESGYYFTDSTNIILNDGTKTVENKTLNLNAGTLSGTSDFTTAKAELIRIQAPDAITGVANGTPMETIASRFPPTVTVKTEDRNVTTAGVTWDLNNFASGTYDPLLLTEQNFTVKGTVTLPEKIANTNNISLETAIQVTVSAAGIVGAPIANPAAGTYTESQSVELSPGTEGADIYYTTDGTTPSKTNGTKYTGAISVTGTEGQSVTTTIKAIAVKDGMQDSSVSEFTYTINIPDTTNPTAKIQIGTHEWNRFWNTVTFGHFFKNIKEVTITASDNVTASPKIEYYLSDSELSETEAKDSSISWTLYTDAISMTANSKKVVYAKVTDDAGNETIVNSAGVVVYTDSAQDTEEITYVKNVTGDVTANVILNGNIVDAITNGSRTLTKGADYTIDEAGKITFKSEYLETLEVSSNPYTLTVSYHPMGENYVESDGNEAPVTTTIALTVRAAGISTKPETPIKYKIIEGTDGTYILGSTEGYRLKANGDFDKFVSVEIDGNVVDSKYYTAKSGSTIIVFTAEYMNMFSIGKHTIKVNYVDGFADTTLTVKKATSVSPKTEDDIPIGLWMAVMTLSSAGFAAFGIKKKEFLKDQ